VERAVPFCFVLIVFLLALSPGLPAQESTPAPPTAQPAQQTPPPEERKETTGYTLSPEKHEKAVAYARSRYWLYFIGFAYGLLVLYVVLRARLAPRFRDWAESASRARFVQALVYVPALTLVLAVLSLPTDLYGQWLSLQYEQSIQSWGSWFWDWTKGQLIGTLIFTVLIWILYTAIRRSPRRWWFYFWLAALPILLFLIFIDPLIIQPLFFKFKPLQETQPGLVAEISRVVGRGGLDIPPARMFEMNASEKLNSLNAYVAGFGASKRVVIWDTTIQKMNAPQILFVFGHEMGHYVLYHLPKFFIFLSGSLLIFLYLGYRGVHWMLARWGVHCSVRGVEDWASLPAILFFISLCTFLFSPVTNTFGRSIEHEADTYGLEVVHGIVPDAPRVAAESFQILGEISLDDPNPSEFIRIWLYGHPPISERVVFAQQYDPWSKGESPRFVK